MILTVKQAVGDFIVLNFKCAESLMLCSETSLSTLLTRSFRIASEFIFY